jgi:hypothetical protein
MQKPDQPVTLPLEYAAQIAFELDSMRRECGELASSLMARTPLNEHGLDECARLDDALAQAHWILRKAVTGIKSGQSPQTPPAG